MSQILLLALAASIPLAALAFLAGLAVEALGAGLRLRLCAWTAALLLPALPVPAMLAIHVLGVPSPLAALLARPQPAVALTAPFGDYLPATVQTAATTPPPASRPPIAGLLLGLAAAGAALRLGQLALGLRRLARLKAASQAIEDAELAARLGHGVRLADTSTPVLAGLRRPTILLPRRLLDRFSPDQAALVCAHERAHLAAGDHLTHLMEETMVRVFWFNPLMASTRERLAAAREEACDARALSGCDDARRRAYAQTLIEALKLAGRAETVAAFTGFRRQGAERRLKAILKPTGPGSWAACAAAILAGVGLAAVAGGFSLAAAAEPKPATSDPLPLPLPPPPPAPAPPVDASAASAPASASADAPAPPKGSTGAHDHQHIATVTVRGPEVVAEVKDIDHGKQTIHTMTFSDQDWQDGHLRPEALARIPPEARAEIEAALKEAHDADPIEKAREMGARFQPLTAEEQERIHTQVEAAVSQAQQAMAQAHPVWLQDDGRVLMRCKVGTDGKATDCVKVSGPVVAFRLERKGPNGEPLPPMPPAAPAPAGPPAPPPLPPSVR